MFRSTLPTRQFYRSYKDRHWMNPARRWVGHKVLLGMIVGGCGAVTFSFRKAKTAPNGEPRFAGTVLGTAVFSLPYATASTIAGELASSTSVPKAVHGALIRYYGGTDEEADAYNTLQEYFVRGFAPGSRPLDVAARMVAPCDGTVVNLADVTPEEAPLFTQVKGHTYRCDALLRCTLPEIPAGYRRFACILQLDTSDIHHVVCPAPEFDVHHSTHIPGTLLPLSVACSRWIPQVYLTNERVSLVGTLPAGGYRAPVKSGDNALARGPFFGMSLVGGFCEGKIKVDFDGRIVTNDGTEQLTSIRRKYTDLTLRQGARVGHFEMGSAVAMLFDVPADGAKVALENGSRVRMGEALVI